METYTFLDFLDLFKTDINSTTILPIIIFSTITIVVIIQIINTVIKRKWILLPATIYMAIVLFTKPLETILITAILSNTINFMLGKSYS